MAIVKSVMKTNLITATPDETVEVVASRMKEHNLGAILLVEDGKLVGIFTERDALNRIAAAGKNPKGLPVKEVATANPVVAKESMHVKECAQILRDRGFRHLPVVNDQGKNVGIISSRDFFMYMTDELEQVIDRSREKGQVIEQDLDIFELVGGGGYGIPRSK